MSPSTAAVSWQQAGHIVFPLRKKYPLVKFGSLHESVLDHPTADAYALRCDKVLVLDLDCYKKDFTTLPKFDMAWLEGYKYTPTPSGGRHYFFAPEPDIRMKTGVQGTKGVDIRAGKGSYVVIYGPVQELPPMPLGLFQILKEDTMQQTTWNKIESDISTHFKVSMYLDKIDADCNMNTWLNVLNAVKTLAGDRDLAWKWSSSSNGDTYKVANEYSFNATWEGLDTKLFGKTRCLKYLKRLANAG